MNVLNRILLKAKSLSHVVIYIEELTLLKIKIKFKTFFLGIVCSYAFALPVATAPNAIVFGHSTMKTTDMMKVDR